MTHPHGRIVIAGGSGFLGVALAEHLTALGCEVTQISRSTPARVPGTHVTWDGTTLGDWASALDGAAALVNLAGRSVDCIKTPEHRDEILRSRVESTRVLGEALRSVDRAPPVWVQMSTAHIYGDPPERVCDEDAAFGEGLAPFVGQAWEAAHADALLPEMRSVVLRTSFVVGRGGGALQRLSGLARFGLGGTVGHGRQGMSWLHLEDMNRIFARSIADPNTRGVYIATAPGPVSNRVFMRELRRAMGMPVGLPAASWMVRIAAPLLLRTDPELALYGRYCVPKRLLAEGYAFAFPELDAALADLFSSE